MIIHIAVIKYASSNKQFEHYFQLFFTMNRGQFVMANVDDQALIHSGAVSSLTRVRRREQAFYAMDTFSSSMQMLSQILSLHHLSCNAYNSPPTAHTSVDPRHDEQKRTCFFFPEANISRDALIRLE